MKKIAVVFTIFGEEIKSEFTLEFKKNKNGEISAVLTVPYVEWATLEDYYIAYRVLTIKDRLLECIEKYYFDENIITMPVQGYPYPVEICDIYYKVLPPKIYDQMLSGTFKINKKADPKEYARFFQKEKENKSAIRQFINEQKKLGFEIKPKSILYARKLNVPSSSNDQLTIILVNKSSSKDNYKTQIHKMNPDSDAEKGTFWQKEFDDIYDAKKEFDTAVSKEFYHVEYLGNCINIRKEVK